MFFQVGRSKQFVALLATGVVRIHRNPVVDKRIVLELADQLFQRRVADSSQGQSLCQMVQLRRVDEAGVCFRVFEDGVLFNENCRAETVKPKPNRQT